VVGAAAFLSIAAVALYRAGRLAATGTGWAAPLVGGITAALVSGVADNLFEAPRLVFLFYLVCFAALATPYRARPR
jgi:hypothetical protein